MSHPVRKWLKDLLQYGRRGVQAPADGKPPLLWLADLPRLGSMWAGHYWFRMWLDLRATPTRITYDPREVFSPHVRLVRPTRLRPIRPLRRIREAFAAFRAWLADGGLERAIARLGGGIAGGVAGLCGAAVVGTARVAGAAATGIAGVFGASAIGAALGLNALGRGLQTAARRTGAGLVALRDGLGEGFAGFAARFRSPREVAWTFATITGTTGLILLMVLQSNGLPAAQKQPRPAASRTALRPPAQVIAQAETDKDPFGGLPDPFGGTPPAQAEPTPAEPAADPFADPAPPEAQPEPEADLDVEIARTALPPDVARFNLPDDDEQFLVEAPSAAAAEPDLASFPQDDWSQGLARDERSPSPVVPAAYREMGDAPPASAPLPAPSDVADRFTPATRSVGVTIRKTQPAAAKSGELLWYDLVVTNRTDEPIAGVVIDEQVAEPHRVADANPPAAFKDGVLSWQLDALRPGEERTLSVAVYPMSADPIVTAAAVRPLATFSTVTLVQEEPADEPRPPRPEPVPTAQPHRRIKIVMTTPDRVTAGSGCVIRFAVTNTGDAPLTGVALRGVLPERLRHAHGPEVETEFGPLAPGQTRTAEMRVTAAALGEAELLAEVSAAEGVATTVRGSFDVVESLPGKAAPAVAAPACCCPVGMISAPLP